MRIVLRVLAWFFIAFALIGLATEIDDAHEGKSKNRSVGIALIVIFTGAGVMILRSTRRPAAPPPPAAPPAPRSIVDPPPKRPDDDFI